VVNTRKTNREEAGTDLSQRVEDFTARDPNESDE